LPWNITYLCKVFSQTGVAYVSYHCSVDSKYMASTKSLCRVNEINVTVWEYSAELE